MLETPPQRTDAAGADAATAPDALPAVAVHESLPPRWPRFASMALLISITLHAGAILAVWSRPSAPADSLADSLALRSGRASVTVQMTLPSPAAPEPRPVEFTSAAAEAPERPRPSRPASELRERGDRGTPSPPKWDSLRPPRPSESRARAARRSHSPAEAPMPTAPERPRERPRRTLPPPSASSPPPVAVADPGVERDTPDPLASNRPPVYPAEAVAARAEGTARLRVTVSDEGAVVALEVQQSSGWSMLDQAALSAVATWRFQPQPEPVRGGKQSVIVPVVFQLDD